MAPALDGELGSAVVSYRPAAGEEASALFAEMPLAGLLTAAPWRTFVWYRGQRHNSGSLVGDRAWPRVYESPHELSCLLLADFDRAVERIVAQPFQLTLPTRPKPTKHVPDFLLSTDQGAVVVDVTWQDRLQDPDLVTQLALDARTSRDARLDLRGYHRLSHRLSGQCALPGRVSPWLVDQPRGAGRFAIAAGSRSWGCTWARWHSTFVRCPSR